MYNATCLVPARFLTLLAHLCVAVTLLWSSQEMTTACLPSNPSPILFRTQHTQLLVGLSVALGLIGFELLAFLTGVTMFHSTSALVSVGSHGSATVLLTFFMLDNWQCGWYWWVFGVCSVVPALIDMWTVFTVMCSNSW